MPLNDLNEDLYNPNSSVDERKHEESQFNPEAASGKIFIDEEKKEWEKSERGLNPQQKRAIKIGIAFLFGIVSILALFAFVFNYKAGSFSEDRVEVSIIGPEEVRSAELAEYRIVIKNNNRAKLKEAQVVVSYPVNFKPEGNFNFKHEGESSSEVYVGDVESFGETEVLIRGRVYAPKDTVIFLKSQFSFVPANFNSIFKIDGQTGVNVQASSISLEVTAPREILSDNSISYTIEYKNVSQIDHDNVRLKIEYADGFSFEDAIPYPLEGENYWYVGNLKAGEEGSVVIKGIVSGVRNDFKLIRAAIGTVKKDGGMLVYNQREEVTKIIASPMALNLKINNATEVNVNEGDTLSYNLSFKNEGDIALRNAILTLQIDSAVLDFSKIILKSGYFDGALNQVTWKASDVPALASLAPGSGGAVSFSVPVKRNIDVVSTLDKEFLVKTVARLESPDMDFYNLGTNQTSSNEVLAKINSRVSLDVLGYYNDSNIENFGPLPPKVGEETTYTIHWLVTNAFNDVDKVSVSSILPPGVRWKDRSYPEYEDLQFNERTGEVVWNIGLIPSGVGVLEFPRTVSFQVGIVPELHQVGRPARLLEKTIVAGQDNFTGVEVRVEGKEKDTSLSEDLGIGKNNYSVVR